MVGGQGGELNKYVNTVPHFQTVVIFAKGISHPVAMVAIYSTLVCTVKNHYTMSEIMC